MKRKIPMTDKVVSPEEALMPTDIPNPEMSRARRNLRKSVQFVLLLLYMLSAVAMLHALSLAAPDALLASAP